MNEMGEKMNLNGLFGLIHESSSRFPDRVYIENAGSTWTYSQVYSMSKSVSRHLLESGIGKGDRVLVFCPNSVQYVAALFGIAGINAIAVPVNPAKMQESLISIIGKATPRLILASDSTIDKLLGMQGQFSTEVNNIDDFLCCDDPEREPYCSEVDYSPCNEEDVAMLLFTSGTTAYPKGVALTHGNLVSNTEAIVEYLNLGCEDSVLMTLPFTYSYGNSILLTHTCVGAAVIIENSTAYPYKVLEGIKEHRVSGFSTVGSYINLMLKCLKNTDKVSNFFRSLRYITFAGESTSSDDVMFISINYSDIKIYIMYGQTEASARLSYLDPGLIIEKKGSIGKGLCNVELKVVDEGGKTVKPGEMGEIIAQGPNIMNGYWKDPDSTREVLRNGWLHTGDYATVDNEGYIYITGRKSDIIKHMGHRISPVEIENVINSCEYIKESAVVEGTLEALHVIKAFVVLDGEHPLDQVRKYVHSKLPLYMRPKIFEAVTELPRTESGKIRRSALRRNTCAE